MVIRWLSGPDTRFLTLWSRFYSCRSCQADVEYINDNLTENIETLKIDETFGLDYTLKALCCVLWAYFYAPSFKEGLLTIINQGGDADTNGCIAGSILGAKFGYENIPKKWLNGLLKKEELENRFKKL